MGEAKRRKELGLAPKAKKQEPKKPSQGLFVKYPRLPLYLIGLFVVILIIDLIKELG
tara:strand:- start:1374 stop:1544 length:171 start_codon:yes stop_codon:yes gene_type:complete